MEARPLRLKYNSRSHIDITPEQSSAIRALVDEIVTSVLLAGGYERVVEMIGPLSMDEWLPEPFYMFTHAIHADSGVSVVCYAPDIDRPSVQISDERTMYHIDGNHGFDSFTRYLDKHPISDDYPGLIASEMTIDELVIKLTSFRDALLLIPNHYI